MPSVRLDAIFHAVEGRFDGRRFRRRAWGGRGSRRAFGGRKLRHREKESEEQWQTIRNSWTASTGPPTTKASSRGRRTSFTVTRTYQYSPPGCHDSCGVLFYVKDGKLDHVEGDPLSPFTNGKLCMRCLDLPEIVNHPDRVLLPHEACARRPRRRVEVRAHHVGRGVRPHRRKGQGHPRGIRFRVHRVRAWHGPQRQLARALVRPGRPADAEHLHAVLHRVRLLHAARLRRHGAFGRLPHSRRRRGARAALRRSLLLPARGDRRVGQRAFGLQRRRLHRALAGAVRADGLAHHLHRPAPHLVGRACGLPPAAAAGNRRGARVRLAERHHFRGPVRPRVRGLLDQRHRRAVGGRARHDARLGGAHLRAGRGGHRGFGPSVRERQQRRHPMGARLRPAGERHGVEPGGVRPHGHLRQHRPPGRQHPRAQLLRDQCGLCVGRGLHAAVGQGPQAHHRARPGHQRRRVHRRMPPPMASSTASRRGSCPTAMRIPSR